MKESVFKSYDEARGWARRRPAGMHQPGFPVLRVSNCIAVPKEMCIQWMEEQVGGAG